VLLVAALPQLKLIAGVMVLSSTAGAVSWLWYANRLFELPLGLVAALVSAILIPALSSARASGERGTGAQARAIEAALALSVPAAAGLVLLAPDIVTVLFQRGAFTMADTAATAPMLAALALGLPGHVLEKVLAADAFADDDTRSPLVAGLAGLVFAIIGAGLADHWIGPAGVALAIGLSGYVGCLLLVVLARRRGRTRFAPSTVRALLAIPACAAAMACALVFLAPWLAGLAVLLRLAVLIVVGMAVYGAAIHVTRAIDLTAFRARRETEPLA
jgi:putative peptidoglycan lipid II flippase